MILLILSKNGLRLFFKARVQKKVSRSGSLLALILGLLFRFKLSCYVRVNLLLCLFHSLIRLQTGSAALKRRMKIWLRREILENADEDEIEKSMLPSKKSYLLVMKIIPSQR